MANTASQEKQQQPIKAYAVTETDEGTGGIFFARHAIVARRRGADEYAGGEFSYVQCKRAPWADAYAETDVPARVMVEHGWRFECYGCGAVIGEDDLHERRLRTSGILGMQNGPIYCCARCKWHDIRLERKSNAIRQEVFEIHKGILMNRLPGVTVLDMDADGFRSRVDVNYGPGGWDWYCVSLRFEFPGMAIAPAEMTTRRPYDERGRFTPPKLQFYCCGGDKEAFEAFAAACKDARNGQA